MGTTAGRRGALAYASFSGTEDGVRVGGLVHASGGSEEDAKLKLLQLLRELDIAASPTWNPVAGHTAPANAPRQRPFRSGTFRRGGTKATSKKASLYAVNFEGSDW